MMPAELRREAESLVRAGGGVLRDLFSEVRTIDFKGHGRGNLVTDADRAAEALIVEALRDRFPAHGVLTEETGTVSTGELTWILDPLDGTTNYAHGVPHFCVSLSAEGPWRGERRVLAAATFDPIRDELFSAARGQGATLNGHRLQVTSETALDRALLCTGFPYDVQLNPEAPLGLFDRLVRQARGMRRMGSAALELAWVAAGRFDGFFEFGLKPWDVAAGALLIEEAGGSIACLDGQPWDSRFADVVAAGPGLFAPLLAQCHDFVATHDLVIRPFGSSRPA
jgi:myo-inositol-1(or 4)-monophosphatase